MAYKADIAGGSLKLYESRIVAALLLQNVTVTQWRHAIEVENILQKRSLATAKRQANLIRARLSTMTADHWAMVHNGPKPTATQAIFAAAIAHSRLLRDFLDVDVRDRFRSGNLTLSKGQWRNFVAACQERDPEMSVWTQSTTDKLGDSVFQILAEVGMLSDRQPLCLQPVHYQTELLDYLRGQGLNDVLRTMQAFI